MNAWKSLRAITLTVLPGDTTSYIMNDSLNFDWIQPNFIAKWVLYSIIRVENLMQIKTGEGCLWCCKEEYKEIQATFRIIYIFGTTGLIPFRFDSYSWMSMVRRIPYEWVRYNLFISHINKLKLVSFVSSSYIIWCKSSNKLRWLTSV